VEGERQALRTLCGAPLTATERAEAARLLANYRFCEPAHQVLFEALRELRTPDPRAIRERLPVFLNNKGFPDLDLNWLFEPSQFAPREALAKIRALVDAGEVQSH